MRAPDAAIGCPRLQPLPEKFTSFSTMSYSRHAAIGTEANASLISHSATSATDRPARCSTLPITFTAPSPVSRGGTPADAQAFTVPMTLSPSAAAVALVDDAYARAEGLNVMGTVKA